MAEIRNCNSCGGGAGSGNRSLCRDSVCIDCDRVLDSCKDKDCFTDTPVRLTTFGQELIDKNASVRVCNAQVAAAQVNLEPIPFNRGFYQVHARFYTRLEMEACLAPGRTQPFDGVAVTDKKVVLYGGEGCVTTFRGNTCGSFCPDPILCTGSSSHPTAVVDTVDPVVLDTKIVDPRCVCSCTCTDPCTGSCGSVGSGDDSDVPSSVASTLGGPLACPHENNKRLLVSLGFFSVVRITRPAQFLVCATEYAVPEKTCPQISADDPCTLFAKMSFPTSEFSTMRLEGE